MPWNLRSLVTCSSTAEHTSSALVAASATVGGALVCRRCSLLFGVACFCAGLGLGVALQEWVLWRWRQVGLFNELLRRLSILESELRALRTGKGGSQRRIYPNSSSTSFRLPAGDEDDEFFDSRSRRTSDDEDDFASVSSQPSSTQITEQFLDHLDKLLDGSMEDLENAYRLCLTRREAYRENAQFQWRLAKATYRCSQSALLGEDAKRTLIYEALEAARSAHSLDPDCSQVHKWMAIVLGSVGTYEGNQARILNGYKFKEHIDQALALDPSDHASHHLKGRWCYGVFMLAWWERKLAATLFATPPSANIEDALEGFQEAERLRPGTWRENQLYLAKCYIELGNYPEAAAWLRRAMDLPKLDTADDLEAQKEVEILLAKYASY